MYATLRRTEQNNNLPEEQEPENQRLRVPRALEPTILTVLRLDPSFSGHWPFSKERSVAIEDRYFGRLMQDREARSLRNQQTLGRIR